MVTEVDHHSIKNRIRDIVKADATVYYSTGADGKFVDCFVGRPYNDAITTHPTPYLFITNDDKLETQKEIGVVQSNTIKSTEHNGRSGARWKASREGFRHIRKESITGFEG